MKYSSPTSSVTEPVAQKILQLVDGLKSDAAGKVLHDNLRQMLHVMQQQHADTERSYSILLSQLLEIFAHQCPEGSPVATQIKILQQRLTPPLSLAELNALTPMFEATFKESMPEANASQEVIHALQGLFSAFGIDAPENNYHVVTDLQQSQPQVNASIQEQQTSGSTQHAQMMASKHNVDTVFRRYLDDKRKDLQVMRQSLSGKLNEAISRSHDFGETLLKELNAIKNVDGNEEIEAIRDSLSREISAIAADHEILKETLANTSECIEEIGLDSEHINDELTRVHTLSLTDELTDLPNRRALQRHLEDEISRAHRHSTELAIAMLDLDDFKQINDTYGHAVGDEVLRSYAREVLSVFRMHDMVARFGGEEFAVILPNTDMQGALAALQKIKNKASSTMVNCDGHSLPMPTCSAGITVYHDKDTVESIMKRCDKALYIAKDSGKNKVEMLEFAQSVASDWAKNN